MESKVSQLVKTNEDLPQEIRALLQSGTDYVKSYNSHAATVDRLYSKLLYTMPTTKYVLYTLLENCAELIKLNDTSTDMFIVIAEELMEYSVTNQLYETLSLNSYSSFESVLKQHKAVTPIQSDIRYKTSLAGVLASLTMKEVIYLEGLATSILSMATATPKDSELLYKFVEDVSILLKGHSNEIN